MDTDAILATSTAVCVFACCFTVLITNILSCDDCRCKRGKCEKDCITCRRRCKKNYDRDCACGRERAETDEELVGV
jgi:hypothetical protein